MIDQIAPYLPYVPLGVGGWFALSLLLLLGALYNLWRRKTAIVWRNRHKADQRGQRLLFWSVANLVASSMVIMVGGSVIVAFGYVEEFFPPRSPYDLAGVAVAVLPAPTRPADASRTPLPTLVTVAAQVGTRGPTRRPPNPTPRPPTQTPTVPPSATPTTTATLSPLARVGVTPPTAAAPLNNGAALRVVAVDDEMTDAGVPVDPATRFPVGVPALHFFTSYRELSPGVVWAWVLYRNGVPVEGAAAVWGDSANGLDWFTYAVPGGYLAGEYEMRLFLNTQQVSRYTFTVAAP